MNILQPIIKFIESYCEKFIGIFYISYIYSVNYYLCERVNFIIENMKKELKIFENFYEDRETDEVKENEEANIYMGALNKLTQEV